MSVHEVDFADGVVSDDCLADNCLRTTSVDTAEMQSPQVVIANIKALCDKCGFVVKVDGHELRCRIQFPEAEIELQRKRAWIGDVYHTAYVRWFLLRMVTPIHSLQNACESFVCAQSQADWYRAYRDQKLIALGTSEHSVSTAFEASFCVLYQFRLDYLKYLEEKFDLEISFMEKVNLLHMLSDSLELTELSLRPVEKFC